jgi:D-sedoheptulose 7-phosphate isomerase
VFSRQIQASAKAQDVVIAISTSDNLKSMLLGLAAGEKRGSFTVGLTGQAGGAMLESCDVCIFAPLD